MAPKVYGSSTIGVKKSTVCTRAHSGESLYTPASSDVSKPTSTVSLAQRGRRARTMSRTSGLSLDAQPAAEVWAVSFLESVTRFQDSSEQYTGLSRLRTNGLRP